MKIEFVAHYLEPYKEPQSILEHLQEVADVARVLAGKIGLPSMGEIAGLLHDLGKYSKDFQVYIRSAEGKLDPDMEPVNAHELKGKIDHSTAGAQMVWGTLKDHGCDPMSYVQSLLLARYLRGDLDGYPPFIWK